MTPTPATAAPQPVYSRRCKERCLGVLYHSGHHQTSDYDAIRREARAAAIAQVRAAWDEEHEFHGPAFWNDGDSVEIDLILDAAAGEGGR